MLPPHPPSGPVLYDDAEVTTIAKSMISQAAPKVIEMEVVAVSLMERR